VTKWILPAAAAAAAVAQLAAAISVERRPFEIGLKAPNRRFAKSRTLSSSSQAAAIVNQMLTMGAQRQDGRVGNALLTRSPVFLIVHPWGNEQMLVGALWSVRHVWVRV
jgi:hypothetical protein